MVLWKDSSRLIKYEKINYGKTKRQNNTGNEKMGPK